MNQGLIQVQDEVEAALLEVALAPFAKVLGRAPALGAVFLEVACEVSEVRHRRGHAVWGGEAPQGGRAISSVWGRGLVHVDLQSPLRAPRAAHFLNILAGVAAWLGLG